MKPPRVDAHGVVHAPGCTLPGWVSTGPIVGVHVLRCAGCQAVRLQVAKAVKS
jgi:hypothetical protein